jgi:hypothetical protein
MTFLKQLARRVMPARLLTALTALRARRHSHRLNDEWGIAEISRRLLDELGPSVRSGPFKGVSLPRAAAPEHLGPYLLGTYEQELHPHWASLERGAFPLIVNVGAKVGYYAVGLHRLLGAPVVAYDADPWARSVLAETVALNNLTGAGVTIRAACSRSDLEALPKGALVVIDCDGCEEVLLRDPLPAGLRGSHLVIELHGAMLENDDTVARLRRTHDVIVVPSNETLPPPADLPFLNDHQRQLAVQEIRTPQRWLLCTPR